jgi:acetoin utilization deacetylase AcuC-like enzyme
MSRSNKPTGFVWHETYMWHDTGNFAGPIPYGGYVQPGQHAENPETKRRFRNLMEVSGLWKELTHIEPTPVSDTDLLRIHPQSYVDKIKTMSDTSGGDAGIFTSVNRGSYEIARLSAGGAVNAMKRVLAGEVRNSYALIRPPGHHAKPDFGMGFCIFANASIAAACARADHGLARVAIVDWDVHHGNGTEAIFYEDPSVLTISIHQDRCFPPDSGDITDVGTGAGEGFNLNVPLPPGSGVGAYEATYDRVVIPALRAFRPELIIVPSGYDAGCHDPLGRMMLTSKGYRTLTAKMMAVADELCDGRLMMTHEGGYDAPSVPFLGMAVMETLTGIKTPVEDPFAGLDDGMGYHALQAHQDAVITKVEELVAAFSSKWRAA